MDRFTSLQLFARIVELGSFSKAANTLEIPRATATHAMRALEERLGVRLLERTTRHVRPTVDGQEFYERCVIILNDLDNAESAVRSVISKPQGTLRVDMHGTHATKIVLPKIDDFHHQYPNINLVVTSGDRLVDLVREGVDCVIRGGNPRDSTLVVKRLAMMPQVICASPQYIAEFGVPKNPSELSSHHVVKFISSNSDKDFPIELMVKKKLREFTLDGWISVCDAENYVISALRGCGLIQVPRFHIADELANGQLVEVLKDWPSPEMPISVLYPYHRERSPRIKIFIEWLTNIYQEQFG